MGDIRDVSIPGTGGTENNGVTLREDRGTEDQPVNVISRLNDKRYESPNVPKYL